MSGLVDAVSFLTRVPVDRRVVDVGATASDHDRLIADAVPWFPVVGALVGALVGLVYWAAAWALPTPVAATMAVTVGVVVTGAFHEDGLADTVDALWGGYDRERRLAILKDSRHGTYGVSALVLSTVLRITALAALAPGRTALGALVAAHALGRGAAVAMMGTTPNARDEGLAAYVRSTRRGQIAAGLVGAMVLGLAGLAGWLVPAAIVAAALTWIVRRVAMSKLGGIVGDVLGGVEQVVEIGVVLVAVAVVHRSASPLGWWPA